jgi:hypothetical protein
MKGNNPEQAAALGAPVPVAEPTVAITFKLSVSIVRALRAYARRSELTLGQIVTRALAAFPALSTADVAERRARRGTLHIQLDYAFDRLRPNKLAHAYEILVPTRARPLEATVKERLHADGSDLCAGLLGAATRGAHDCEPDRGADRVGEDARSRNAEGLDLRRRGL